MSIGINDMQSAWQPGGVASLQQANIPGINSIQIPDWLKGGVNKQIGELTSAYSNIGTAYDPTGQVQARESAAAYNTSAGSQAASNAASEYSNRAAQSGGSGLGAGVVKAQSMMPVYARNNALKTEAADVAAKTYQAGATLAAQIASTIGELRTSYLNTLTGYAQGQQQLSLEKYKAEQATAAQAAQTRLGYTQDSTERYKADLAARMAQQQTDNDQARLAAQAIMGLPQPSAAYTTNNLGQVTSGQASYDALTNWKTSRSQAQQALQGMM